MQSLTPQDLNQLKPPASNPSQLKQRKNKLPTIHVNIIYQMN
jgi:hypothetical protein